MAPRFGLLRCHRLIKKKFGNYRNLGAWIVAIVLAVYALDSFLRPELYQRAIQKFSQKSDGDSKVKAGEIKEKDVTDHVPKAKEDLVKDSGKEKPPDKQEPVKLPVDDEAEKEDEKKPEEKPKKEEKKEEPKKEEPKKEEPQKEEEKKEEPKKDEPKKEETKKEDPKKEEPKKEEKKEELKKEEPKKEEPKKEENKEEKKEEPKKDEKPSEKPAVQPPTVPAKSAAPAAKPAEPAARQAAGAEVLGLVKNCGLTEACPAGKFSYLVKSGSGRSNLPVICFNNVFFMTQEKNSGSRGINLIVINPKTLKLESMKTFDVYDSDKAMLEFIRSKIKNNLYILGASHDEASFKLTSASRKAYRAFGVTILDKADFRDSYVFLGQYSLNPGEAVEKLSKEKDKDDYPLGVEISGCVGNPMGKLVDRSKFDRRIDPPRAISTEAKNCGVPKPCEDGSFSLRLYSGLQNREGIKICYEGKYVMSSDLNDGGRGLNFLIVNPETKEIQRVSRFDTFSEDPNLLEMFIEMLDDDSLIMVVAHDEASQRLNEPVRQALESLGSSFIQQVGFRDVWAFVGKKGMKGFSPYEELHYSESDRERGILEWPRPIDYVQCIPFKFEPLKEKRVILRNPERREFCRRYDGHAEFCDEDHIDRPIPSAVNVSNTILRPDHEIFKVPIAVVPGLNHHAARQQLEAIMLNPGIKPEMIEVYYDEKFDEAGALAKLFGVTATSIESSIKYAHLLAKALERCIRKNKNAKYVIVLEEEVIPSPDFLNYLGQFLGSLSLDKNLVAVSAWNNNGYQDVSDDTKVAFKTTGGFPGLGFLLKVSFYDENMKGTMKKCCLDRAWEGWFPDKNLEIIVPGSSRVKRGRHDGRTSELLKELFNRPRYTAGDELIKMTTNYKDLIEEKYADSVKKLLSSAKPYPTEDLMKCVSADGTNYKFPDLTSPAYVIYFTDSDGNTLLRNICKCLKLYSVPRELPRDVYRGMLRFSRKDSTVFLVGSRSEFAKNKPSSIEFLKS